MITLGCGSILITDGRVLLVRRQNSSTFNEMWSNPGGKVEPKESVEDAVVREMEEEVGVHVKILRRISDYEDCVAGKVIGRYTGYLVEVVKGEPRRKELEKIAEIKYFSLKKLPTNLAPYTKQYLRDLGY